MHFLTRSLLAVAALPYAVLGDWPIQTFQSMDFTPPQLEITKSGAPTAPGYLFVAPRGNPEKGVAPLIYSDDGDLIYQGPNPMLASNFRVQNYKGQDVLTWWEGDMLVLGYGYGTFHMLDNTYKEIHRVALQEHIVTYDGSVRDSYADEHESRLTPSGTLLVTAYNVTNYDLRPLGGGENDYVLDGLIYEIDVETNEVLFTWSCLEHLDSLPLEQSHQVLAEDYGKSPEKAYDIFHINAAFPVDGGYIVSIRHHWSALYVAKDGHVVWRLDGENGGDFTLGEGANFSWQHDIQVEDETPEGMTMYLFNNANTPDVQGPPSTGMRLKVDLVQKKVDLVQALDDPNDPVHSISQGGYQIDPTTSHGIVSYGSISKVKEFDEAGNVILSAKFGDDGTVASYRGFKCQWSATPFWAPDLAASTDDNGKTTVAMSWNGATDYTDWAIYAIRSRDPLTKTLVQKVPRTGFETVATVDLGGAKEIQIEATKGGQTLGASEVIDVTDPASPTATAAPTARL